MEENDLRDLESLFAQVEDPRMERTKLHRLRDIIILAICGVLCGADGWVEIEEFGKAKEAFFTDLLNLPNGIPSHDTFGRVFALIDPKQFEASFVQWVQGISQRVKGVIAIDGKTLRRSYDQESAKKALHVVSAWAVENQLSLPQKRSQMRLPRSPFFYGNWRWRAALSRLMRWALKPRLPLRLSSKRGTMRWRSKTTKEISLTR
jgi:DDE_Tnp_1-associated